MPCAYHTYLPMYVWIMRLLSDVYMYHQHAFILSIYLSYLHIYLSILTLTSLRVTGRYFSTQGKRPGGWSLPGGGIDDDELPAAAAADMSLCLCVWSVDEGRWEREEGVRNDDAAGVLGIRISHLLSKARLWIDPLVRKNMDGWSSCLHFACYGE